MKITSANNRTYEVKRIVASVNPQLKPMVTIFFEPGTIDAVKLLEEFNAGTFNSFSAMYENVPKTYNGYTYLVSIQDRLGTPENEIYIILSTMAPTLDSDIDLD